MATSGPLIFNLIKYREINKCGFSDFDVVYVFLYNSCKKLFKDILKREWFLWVALLVSPKVGTLDGTFAFLTHPAGV